MFCRIKKILTFAIPLIQTGLFAGKTKNTAIWIEIHAKVAQLVERDLAKVEVAGSNPVFRSKR